MQLLRAWARAAPALLLTVASAASAARPRAAAVVAAPPSTDLARRAALGRAALDALDRLMAVAPVRAPALRDALSPRVDLPDPAAEAHALAAAAAALGARDAAAAIEVYEKAVALAFERLPVGAARAWALRFGKAAREAYLRAGRGAAPAARRLRRWLEERPTEPTGEIEIRARPEEARIFLDGRPVGRGPSVRVRHEVGRHDLSVELEGYAPVRRAVEVRPGAPPVEVSLAPLGPTEEISSLVARLDGDARRDRPLLTELGRRLDVALVFVVSPDDGGVLVRLFDVAAEGFVAASPVATADPSTLARAFRAVLDLRDAGASLTGAPRRRERAPARARPLWKKWWVWTLVLGTAGAVTGAVFLARQGSDEGSLTIRLRRTP